MLLTTKWQNQHVKYPESDHAVGEILDDYASMVAINRDIVAKNMAVTRVTNVVPSVTIVPDDVDPKRRAPVDAADPKRRVLDAEDLRGRAPVDAEDPKRRVLDAEDLRGRVAADPKRRVPVAVDPKRRVPVGRRVQE